MTQALGDHPVGADLRVQGLERGAVDPWQLDQLHEAGSRTAALELLVHREPLHDRRRHARGRGQRDDLLLCEALEGLVGLPDVGHAPARLGRSGGVEQPMRRYPTAQLHPIDDPVVVRRSSPGARSRARVSRLQSLVALPLGTVGRDLTE